MEVEIKDLLRQTRRQADLSQGEVSKILDVNLATVHNWERGKSQIPTTKLIDYFNKVLKQPMIVVVDGYQKRLVNS